MAAALVDSIGMLERAEALRPALAERANEAETLRRLHPDTVRDLGESDMWRMVVPESLGGHGLDVRLLANVTRILGQGCVASAWTASFLIMHNWMLTKFPAAARDELFGVGDPWALVPAPLAPTGTCEPVDGGFRLNGRWEWATGIHHSDWVMVHAVQAEPEFAMRFALLPIADVEIDDVWYTSGMKATGSDTVRVEGVVVPAHRTIESTQLIYGGDDLVGDGMSKLPVPQVLSLVAAAPALGAAQAAVELFRARVNTRVLAYSLGDRAAEQPAAQIRLGTVISELAAARTQWDAALDELNSWVGNDSVPIERRMALRLAASATVRSARSIVNTIAEGAGASVYFDDSPFQRIQRDLEVLKGHVIFDWDRTAQLAGKVALGIELSPADMV